MTRPGCSAAVVARAALALALALALAVTGCAPDASKERSRSPDEIPPSLVGLPQTIAEIGDRELRVAVADTPEARRRGLMGVADLGSVDGMVFVYDTPTDTGFYMKDVLVPLDITFIGADGTVLAVQTMALCAVDPCPLYRSPAPFMWAVETPGGGLAEVAPGDRFSLRP